MKINNNKQDWKNLLEELGFNVKDFHTDVNSEKEFSRYCKQCAGF